MEPELVLDLHADLLEGPIWDDQRQRLLFVDIMRGHVHEFDPTTRVDRITEVGQPVGAIALASRGDWVIATKDGFHRLDPDSGKTTLIALVEADRPETRMNDGYVDAHGRFWAGTMGMDGVAGRGTLYRLDPDGSVHAMLAPVTTSNGIDWSNDGRLMYYIDTRTHRVDVFDFDEVAGTIANRRVFAAMPDGIGRPDGLIVDAADAVWVALYTGGAVHRYAADGHIDRVIRFPVTLTTKPAFGGPDLTDLYVTSAAQKLTDADRAAQPHAGGLFCVRRAGKGRLARRWA